MLTVVVVAGHRTVAQDGRPHLHDVPGGEVASHWIAVAHRRRALPEGIFGLPLRELLLGRWWWLEGAPGQARGGTFDVVLAPEGLRLPIRRSLAKGGTLLDDVVARGDVDDLAVGHRRAGES
jgi:hypothetical protein